MKYIYTLFLALLCITTYAQDITLDWANQINGSDTQGISKIVTDINGNIYTVGTFSGTVDFDSSTNTFSLTSNGMDDIFISKINSTGDFIWAKQIGGIGIDRGSDIAIDTTGNIYITGSYMDTVDFDPNSGVLNLTAIAGLEAFVTKLNTNGNLLWAKSTAGDSNEEALNLSVDNNGNVYVTGYFWGTINFDPGNSNFSLNAYLGFFDTFIYKLDTSGNFVWAKQLDSNQGSYGISIATDVLSNILIGGFFYGTTDFDPGNSTQTLTINGFSDGYVLKLDTNGDFLWVKQLKGHGIVDQDYGGEVLFKSLCIDSMNNVIIAGTYSDTMDFNPSNTQDDLKASFGNTDSFIIKLDNNGNYIWGDQIGGISNDFVFEVVIDTQDRIYTSGRFEQTSSFGIPNTTTLTSQGSADIFLSRYNADGTMDWVKQFGGSGLDSGVSVQIDNSNDIIVSGGFNATADFGVDSHNVNITANGNNAIFYQKLTACSLDDSVSISGNTLTSNNTTGNYQWVDCDSGTDIPGETNQLFTPTANGNYAVRVSYNNCEELSSCNMVTSLDVGEYNSIDSVTIFPVPTQGKLHICLGSLTNTNIKVTNTLGQIVYKNHVLNGGIHELELAGSDGLYFVEIQTDKKTRIYKVIKS